MDSDTDDASDTCIPLTRSARRSNQCRVRILTEREVHDVLNCTGRGLNRFYSHFALTPDSPSWPSWIFVSLYSLGLAPAVLIDTHHTQTHRAQTYSIQDSPEVAPRPTRTSARSRKTALETNQAAARTTTSPSPLTFSPCQTAIWTSYTSHQKPSTVNFGDPHHSKMSRFKISGALWDKIHHFASFPQTGGTSCGPSIISFPTAASPLPRR
jgi:hypothetical protein